MSYTYTEREFAAKIDWEGGVEAALDYGLRSEDLEPCELKNVWEQLEDVYKVHFYPRVRNVEALLEDIDTEEEEEDE